MPYQMWINGKHTLGTSGSIIEVYNPASEEIIDTASAAPPTWTRPSRRGRLVEPH